MIKKLFVVYLKLEFNWASGIFICLIWQPYVKVNTRLEFPEVPSNRGEGPIYLYLYADTVKGEGFFFWKENYRFCRIYLNNGDNFMSYSFYHLAVRAMVH